VSILGHRRIGFVGGGNMAEAMIRGLTASGAAPAERVRASDINPERREHLGARYGIATGDDNAALAAWADLIVLAVKPQSMGDALASLPNYPCLWITIAAGVPAATIESALPGSRVIRAMPNTPALVLAGATAIAAGARATDEDLALAEGLFRAVGTVVRVPESALDAVTGLSGSGPGYVMAFLEALVDGGVAAGLPRDTAATLAAHTLLGAAKLVVDTGEDPAVLRARVTSPGGTTLSGLERLAAAGFHDAVVTAVEAATRRAAELGKK
jgi:pyrroline-5-carboxylate reductase